MPSQHEPRGQRDPGSSIEENTHEPEVRESREQLITRREAPRADADVDAEDPLRRGSPLALIRRFSEDIDQLVASLVAPDWSSLDVSDTEDKLIVQASLPGLQKDDIIVELRGSELRISDKQGLRRTVPLPTRVSADAVSAGFEDGILRIEIDTSRDAAPRGRRIEVRSGDER